MNRLIETTFRNRGYTEEFLREINNSQHEDLKDVNTLCSRLKYIHDNNLPITVYPDFDTDGIVAGTVGFAGLAELGFNVNLFVPDVTKGYGIDVSSVESLLERFPDTKAIITCDTGISAFEAADFCRDRGIEFLVTDHHNQTAVSSASVIVNPMRLDETYAHPGICGAYVFYQVLEYYSKAYCNYFAQDQIRRLKVFAGIGTVSDTMPILYENRQVVRDAISICKMIYGDGSTEVVAAISGCDIYRKAFWGLYEVLKMCEENGIIKDINSIDEDFFGFYVAPVFNSVKRMEGDMNRAFGAFFSNNLHDDANYLYQLNVLRKTLVEQEFADIKSRYQPYAPFVYITDAKPGVLGLLATKLMAETGYPTFALNLDSMTGEFHGSGRCPDWYTFPDSARKLMFMSGHDAAFGCGCNSGAELFQFVDILSKDVPAVAASITVAEDHPDFVIATDWSADTGIDIGLFRDYLAEIDNYRPFGKGFPAPNIKLVFSNNDVVEWKQMGKAKQHLKISLGNGFDILCWNQGQFITLKDTDVQHVVYGRLGQSEFRNVVSVNFSGDLVQ